MNHKNSNNFFYILHNFLFQLKTQYVDQLEIDEYKNKKKYPSSWEIPICYNEKYGLDLQFISDNCNLSIDEVIETHQKKIYQVKRIKIIENFNLSSK